jgi:hypothetical protein
MFSRKLVQHMVIDTTHTYSELCDIGRLAKTDKTPYGDNDLPLHRHPYTGVYSIIFSPLKNKEIEFAEIGVAGGSSVILWWNYFSKASFAFFDRDQNFLNNVEKMEFPSKSPYLGLMDVSIDGNVTDSLLKTGRQFDIIIDDNFIKFDFLSTEGAIRFILQTDHTLSTNGMMHGTYDDRLFICTIITIETYITFVDIIKVLMY